MRTLNLGECTLPPVPDVQATETPLQRTAANGQQRPLDIS